MEIKRLFDFLTHQLERNPDLHFLSVKTTLFDDNKQWKHFSYRDLQDNADKVSRLLLDAGIEKGDKIAIISENRPEWNFVDMGSQQIGVVNVPMYPTISEEDYEFIFRDSGIKFAFVGNDTIYQKVLPLMAKLDGLKGIVTFDKLNGTRWLWDELEQIENPGRQYIDAIKSTIVELDIATIIYTSGTTGNPKGVMLTHQNIVSNLTGVAKVLPFRDGEKSLSFLPLCHSFERTVFYAYLMMNIHIYYAENLETIGDNLKEVQPYCFTTVPRLLEKVYEKIMAKGHELTGIRKSLFFWSVRVGSRYKLGHPGSLIYRLQLRIARKLVFSKWLEALGGRVEFIVTGAAAMQPRLITIFSAAGINVIEGYGLTETSPVLTVNRISERERCLGTIGMPIPGVEIKLAEDGEILARGLNIMKGYFNRPDLTAEVIDSNGWFHTGDIGEWKEHFGNNFLKITDRKKELFKTAGGKYIAPQAIENKMKESRFIEQIMVVGGDDYKYIGALIVPSFVQLNAWAVDMGISTSSNQNLINSPEVLALMLKEVERLNVHFGKWEQIKKIRLLSEEWTIESGMLTPTLKLKRKFLYARFKEEIADILQG
ncbi:MAG: AMP-dependent synthetase and ligase [Candidatus Parvibacillus calidus]|nr:MAG: AMP-dependent synthetase and ligase [Candidatus Parvibacillus calidus]WKZ64706.1 MAG: long-chain fatty acid--CoA ligase [Saprospiraceae bacterium]